MAAQGEEVPCDKVYQAWRCLKGTKWGHLDLCWMTYICGITSSRQLQGLPSSLQSLTLKDFNEKIPRLPPLLHSLTLMGSGFEQKLGSGYNLPRELRHLTLPPSFDQSLHDVLWPPNLLSLTLGTNFNHSLQSVKFPVTLESLSFGWCFSHSLQPVYERLPNLKRLRLDSFRSMKWVKHFSRLEQLDMHIPRCEELTMLPSSLRSLTIRGCQDFLPASLEALIKLETLKIFGKDCMANTMVVHELVKWPESLRSMTLDFDLQSSDMQLPSALEELNFKSGKIWNLQFPASLVSLDLGELFYPNLHELCQLPNLQHLKLGRCAKIVFPLPATLRSLHLRDSQGPQPTAMPLPELEELDLGDRFNSPVFFPLPAKLKSLRFGKRFNHSLANIKFPETLETLSFGAAFTQHILLPPKLQKLEFRGSFKLDGVKLPQSLRSLKIGGLESLESPTVLDSLELDDLEYLDEFMCQGLSVGCNNVAPETTGW